jgi:hypothetical protein
MKRNRKVVIIFILITILALNLACVSGGDLDAGIDKINADTAELQESIADTVQNGEPNLQGKLNQVITNAAGNIADASKADAAIDKIFSK